MTVLCWGGYPSAQAPDNENGFEPRLPDRYCAGGGGPSYGRARLLTHALAGSLALPPPTFSTPRFLPSPRSRRISFSFLFRSLVSASRQTFCVCVRVFVGRGGGHHKAGGKWRGGGAGDIPTLSSLSPCHNFDVLGVPRQSYNSNNNFF